MASDKIDWSQYEVKEDNEPKIDWSQYEVKSENDNENRPMEMELTKFNPPKEMTGWKGLTHDAQTLLRNALISGVGFAKRAPGNLKEIGSDLIEHPFSKAHHISGQILAGLGEGAKGLANIPHELFDEFANKEITPNWLRTGAIPEDIGIEKFLGLEATKKSDELLRALPAIYGGGKLVASGIGKAKKLTQAPDLKQALKDVQAKVNSADTNLGKAFDKIESDVESRGVTPIPVSKQTINRAKRFLDKSPETRELIDKASKGDYKSLRQIQADLRVIGENGLSNDLSTERNIGKEALSARNQINTDIEKHLEKTGHKDLADLLNKSKEGYKDIQDIYFSNPALARVFGKSQKLPKNPLTLLTEDSTEMNRFFKENPEMKTLLEKALKHSKNKKRISNVASVLGIGTTAEIARKVFGGK